MEALIVLWVIGYTLWRTSSDTARNSLSLLRGHEPKPRQRGAELPASPTARTLGSLFGWWWAAFLATWRGSWKDGQARREAGGPWQPWQPWEPFTRPDGPAPEPTPSPNIDPAAPDSDTGRGRRPADPTAGDGAGPQRPDASPGGGPGPRPAGRPHVVPPRTPPADPPAGEPQTEAAPVMEPAGAGDDEPVDGWPKCWSDLDTAEQTVVIAYDRDESAEPWEALTEAQRAAAVARWISDRYGVQISDVDVLEAQAGREDPTWQTGAPCPECALYGQRKISANPNDHAPACPVGDFFRPGGGGPATAPAGAPVGWSDLSPDAQRQIVAAAEAKWGKRWRALRDYQRATAVAEWLTATYGGAVDPQDVLNAGVKGDMTWATGVPCAECAASALENRFTSSTSTDHDPDCPDRRFLANREAGYNGGLDQDGYRVDAQGNRLPDQGDTADTAPPVTAMTTRALVDERAATAPLITAAAAGGPSDALARMCERFNAVTAELAARDALHGGGETPAMREAVFFGPTDPGSARAADPAHDPAAITAGPSLPGGTPTMTVTSGETTNISKARTYFTELSAHASGHIAGAHIEPSQARFRELQDQAVAGIAGAIERAASYFGTAGLSDPAVLAAVTAAQESANKLGRDFDEVGKALATAFETAHKLATDAAAVLTAFDAHRRVEEAVKTTTGVAERTDFYQEA